MAKNPKKKPLVGKDRVNAFVFKGEGLRHFQSLREAEGYAGVELTDGIKAFIDDKCTVCLIRYFADEPVPDTLAPGVEAAPEKFRHLFAIGATAPLAIVATFSNNLCSMTDPLFTADIGDFVFTLVAPASRMARYLAESFGIREDFKSRTAGRWVVARHADGSLYMNGAEIFPVPGTPLA